MVAGQLTYPDYGVYPSTIITPEGDLGEIIARLGGPRFRREGRILSFADCNPSLDGWIPDGGPYVYQGYGLGYNGAGYLAFLGLAGTPGSISKILPLTQSLRMGLDIMVNPRSNNNRMILSQVYYKGGRLYWAQIELRFVTGDIYYFGDDGNWHLLINTNLIQETNAWLNAKLISDADITIPSYVRLIINNTEFAINYPLYNASTPRHSGGEDQLAVYSHDAVNAYNAFVGNIVITTNER